MPLQLYDKESILNKCLKVFACHGYDNTSTAMLAEAAGVSKALIFHHFKSKKGLYLSLLDRSVAKAKAQLDIDVLKECEDFFKARGELTRMKFEFNKKNPDIYKILKEAYLATPDDLKAEMAQRSDAFLLEKNAFWEQLFAQVPLKDDVDRGEAFELVVMTLDYFDQKYLEEMTPENELDELHVQNFLEKRNNFLKMIRFGFEG